MSDNVIKTNHWTGPKTLIEAVGKYTNIAHVVIVVEYDDGFTEVMYDRQPINSLLVAKDSLAYVCLELMAGPIVENHGKIK